MTMPSFMVRLRQWPPNTLESWQTLVATADKMSQGVGRVRA